MQHDNIVLEYLEAANYYSRKYPGKYDLSNKLGTAPELNVYGKNCGFVISLISRFYIPL